MEATTMQPEVCCEAKALLKKIQDERRMLERDTQQALSEIELKTWLLEQQQKTFEMKWKMLEEETRRLADDKAQFERKKAFFERCYAYEKEGQGNIVNGEMFFSGVASGTALKKRYRDLIKIYHPDSESGDKRTIQEINREYDNLKKALAE